MSWKASGVNRWSPIKTSTKGEKCFVRNVNFGPSERFENAASSSLLNKVLSPLPQWVLVSRVNPNQRLKSYVALRPTPRGLDSRRLLNGSRAPGSSPWTSAPGSKNEYPPNHYPYG